MDRNPLPSLVIWCMRKSPCQRMVVALALVLVSLLAAVPQWAYGASASAPGDPAALVNPFIGTGNGGAVTGDVDTFPGAVVPFGMLSWSPTTPSRPEGGDYAYKDSSILGFSLTHLSGPGCQAGGEIPILPTTGKVGAKPQTIEEPFSHQYESAHPGSYQVTLNPGDSDSIAVALAATARTGIGTFHFPAGQLANFVFKVSDAQAGSSSASVRIIGDRKLSGAETSGHFCGSASSETTYFVAEFNRPFHAWGTWQGHSLAQGSRGSTGPRTGAWVSFPPGRRQTVKLKVAISYVSVADAWKNLRMEDPGWSRTAVATKAHRAWNQMLSRISVRGAARKDRVQFYTALYHSLLHPNLFSDANGKYIGFDRKVHQLSKGQGAQYANFSGWDIYRSQIPLLSLLVPHRVDDMVRSLLNDQAQGGWLPKWGYDNDYTGVMNGDAADPVIAEAYAFGVRGFNAKAALAAMVHGATHTSQPSTWSGGYVERPHLRAYERLGYVPGNASETLEYAIADYAIARLAKYLGDHATYQKFLHRSGDWRNTFDPHARFRGYAGYSEPRAADGSFAKGSAFHIRAHSYGQRGFEEGNTIQYTWMVPQDLGGLIRAMGGKNTAVKRLDLLFTHLNVGPNKPFYWAGNEPALTMPWVYDYAGAPYKTQALVHRLVKQVYADTPGGEPGNDDLGAMSSWLVWSYLGLYPETPGAPVLVVGAPVFSHATLRFGNGKVVRLSAPGASVRSYVHRLSIDGKRWSKDWLPVSRLLAPGENDESTRLDFVMGEHPDRSWASSASDEPPSYASPAGDGGTGKKR